MDRKQTHFKGISGHFQTLMSSRKFYLTEVSFQRRRNEVKRSYKTQDMGPPIQVFFSDFHEVPTCDEIMGKWSQEEMCNFEL